MKYVYVRLLSQAVLLTTFERKIVEPPYHLVIATCLSRHSPSLPLHSLSGLRPLCLSARFPNHSEFIKTLYFSLYTLSLRLFRTLGFLPGLPAPQTSSFHLCSARLPPASPVPTGSTGSGPTRASLPATTSTSTLSSQATPIQYIPTRNQLS